MIALCAVAALGAGCVPPPQPNQADLIDEATVRVQAIDPDAIVFQASGVNGASPDGTGSQTLSYTFLAADPGDADVTHELIYDGESCTTTTRPFPVIGVGYYDLRQVVMTEARARAVLEDAGQEDDFYGWSLYRPLHPSSLEALYAFNYGDKTVMVNTETEVVTVHTVESEPVGFGVEPGDDSVSLLMIAAADERIKEQARSAFIVWAGGRDSDASPLQSAADTNVWDFAAVSPNGSGVPAWRLTYDGEWTVQDLPFPPFEIEYVDLNTTLGMDVVEAWSLAVEAGYDPPYYNWEVFKPLNPSAENPVYVFPSSEGFIIVDTVTGEVGQETNCCATRVCYGHCNE